MGAVHRNGIPPKKLHSKEVLEFNDWEFDEQGITDWARENLEGHMQYDFIVFNGSKGKLNRSVELTVWFQNKADAEMFREAWIK